MQTYYVSRAAAAVAAVVLMAAGWFSIRLARADAAFRTHDPASVARAIELAHGNAEYLQFEALQRDYNGGDPSPLLQRAAALDPLASEPRIRLGLNAEIRGNFTDAEKWLLDAASIDRQFEPRWTLANFYFRRGNQAEFWRWIRRALEVSHGDRIPAFDLCWRMDPDAREIFSRAIPDLHDPVAAYLEYLLETHRGEQAGPVALKLAAYRSDVDRLAILQTCDRLIEARNPTEAAAVWQAMGYSPGGAIFNGNFAQKSSGHGFDWRLPAPPGVSYIWIDSPRTALRIALNGQQPEACDLASEVVRLEPGKRYLLRWRSQASDLESPTGIEWRIVDRRAEVSSGDQQGEFGFTADSELETVALHYQRPIGEARAKGSIQMADISIAEIP
ncbi:MAG: hypothetical protein ACRD30_08310 [Bryobacteraceae bacterium]